MNNVQNALFFDVVVVIIVPLVVMMFSDYERFTKAFITFIALLWLSFVGWIVFVAVHFIGKYW